METKDYLSYIVHEIHTTGSSGYCNKTCVFQLCQDFSYDDRIRVDTSGKEVTRYLVFVFEYIDAGEDMQRDGKST